MLIGIERLVWYRKQVDLRKCYMDESSPFLNSFRHFGEALTMEETDKIDACS